MSSHLVRARLALISSECFFDMQGKLIKLCFHSPIRGFGLYAKRRYVGLSTVIEAKGHRVRVTEDEACASEHVLSWNGTPRRWSYSFLHDWGFQYIGGPMSLVNGACMEHANVELDYDECVIRCRQDMVIDVGDDLLACYSDDERPIEGGVIRYCAWLGCQTMITQ